MAAVGQFRDVNSILNNASKIANSQRSDDLGAYSFRVDTDKVTKDIQAKRDVFLSNPTALNATLYGQSLAQLARNEKAGQFNSPDYASNRGAELSPAEKEDLKQAIQATLFQGTKGSQTLADGSSVSQVAATAVGL